MNKEQLSLKQIIDNRLKKLNDIMDYGLNPYPNNYNKKFNTEYIIKNQDKLIDKEVGVAGRIISQRKMGKVTFLTIQDGSSKLQLLVKKDLLDDGLYYNLVRKLDIGDIVGTTGELFFTKTKELSIKSKVVTILAKAIRPLPNLKEKDGKVFFSFDDKEQRYRKRYLDLIANPEIVNIFKKRSKVIQSLRNYLDDNSFIEVETPILQPLYGGANAKPFKTYHNTLKQDLFLRIADELYLKRLIIGGFDKVYEIAKNFRNEGMDKNHNPEFTMLEFYCTYSDINDVMDFTEKMLKDVVSKTNDSLRVNFNDSSIDFNNKFHVESFFTILTKYSSFSFDKISSEEMFELLKKNNVKVNKQMSKGKLLDKAFSHFVEPKLIQPTFIINYPLSLSPLAKKSTNDANLVDRFELFIGGMEVANAFTELNDPLDQRQRFEEQANLRKIGDDEAQTLDEDFLEAMECGMPPTAGVGIGIDTIIMLITEQTSIKDVILFPALKNND